jgi:hypothetical protein
MRSEVLSKGFATGGFWRKAAIQDFHNSGLLLGRIVRGEGDNHAAAD